MRTDTWTEMSPRYGYFYTRSGKGTQKETGISLARSIIILRAVVIRLFAGCYNYARDSPEIDKASQTSP
jgi:hypothetical protein